MYNNRECKVKNTCKSCEKEVLQDYEMQERFLINLKYKFRILEKK